MEKLCLVGAAGKMGQMLTELKPDWFVCGIDQVDANRNYPVYKSFNDIPEDTLKQLNGIIDFSNKAGFRATLDFALKNALPLLVGTTGLSQEDLSLAQEASKKIPVLISSNMSIGVNTILAIIADLAQKLGSGYDIEIIEKHHNQKVDAPSGTALLIADTINNSQENRFSYTYDRASNDHKRDENEIGIISLRGGTLPGEHSIIFAGNDEVIELKHTAYSRKIFAEGALKGIAWLINQKPNFYTYQDVIINE